MPAVLIDLDDTLIADAAAADAAFLATARAAAEHAGVDAPLLAQRARVRARELWRASPQHPYCLRIGVSSWEGLWCAFEGDGAETRALRAWAPAYRRETWRLALSDQGVDDARLAEELGERFGRERRARHRVYEDCADALDRLAQTHALALVTNGASCLQREKLTASGLADRFDAVVISGDLGVGKPDRAVFARALQLLQAEAADAVMVGDSLASDVDGATAAGLRAVWVNRERRQRPAERAGLPEIHSLAELGTLLAT
jgi:putative hydrolase of the HAD superfamily